MAKKDITITLYVSEIVYEIKNKTHITGLMYREADAVAAANRQVTDEEACMNQIMRSVGDACGTLRHTLSEYLKAETTSGGKTDNIQTDGEVGKIEFTLSMPSNFNKALVGSISAGMHRYIVDEAISLWFGMTGKEDAAQYATYAAADLEALRLAVNERVRPQRPE